MYYFRSLIPKDYSKGISNIIYLAISNIINLAIFSVIYVAISKIIYLTIIYSVFYLAFIINYSVWRNFDGKYLENR